jgi:hypothetical protein
MPLQVIVGTDSWCNQTYALAYFAKRWKSGDWVALSSDEQVQLLVTAFKWIQQQDIFLISPTETHDDVKQAQCEAAWYLYKYWEDQQKSYAFGAQQVRNFSIGSFSQRQDDPGNTPMFPPNVSEILCNYKTRLGGSFPAINRSLESNSAR